MKQSDLLEKVIFKYQTFMPADLHFELRQIASEVRKREDWIDMFTIDQLEGTFNHYMDMQKRAIHGQSGESTIAFWHGRAKEQLEIIDKFKALELVANLENLTTPTK